MTTPKIELYRLLAEQIDGILMNERDWLANLANFSALIAGALPDLNWAGFYLYRSGLLVVGPFQGTPACTRIELGKGVCGAAAERCNTVIVPDVRQFPGHIACDAASRSEIVVPLLLGDRLLGVLDLDAPLLARFDEADAIGLETVVELLVGGTDWPDSLD